VKKKTIKGGFSGNSFAERKIKYKGGPHCLGKGKGGAVPLIVGQRKNRTDSIPLRLERKTCKGKRVTSTVWGGYRDGIHKSPKKGKKNLIDKQRNVSRERDAANQPKKRGKKTKDRVIVTETKKRKKPKGTKRHV